MQPAGLDRQAVTAIVPAHPTGRTLVLALDLATTPPRVALSVRRSGDVARPSTPARIGVEVVRPRLPYADERFDTVVALDVLEHVLDEERWLAELARITRPGGRLTLRVPATGPLSWLDALNIYRYVVEISNRGTAPRQTQPIGWHRHYSHRELAAMLSAASFRPISAHHAGTGLDEIPGIAGLMTLDWLLGLRNAERKVHRARARLQRLDDKLRIGPIGTELIIEAVRL